MTDTVIVVPLLDTLLVDIVYVASVALAFRLGGTGPQGNTISSVAARASRGQGTSGPHEVLQLPESVNGSSR